MIDSLCLDWVFFYILTNILFAMISRSRGVYTAAMLSFLFFIVPVVFVLIRFFSKGQLLPIIFPLTVLCNNPVTDLQPLVSLKQ